MSVTLMFAAVFGKKTGDPGAHLPLRDQLPINEDDFDQPDWGEPWERSDLCWEKSSSWPFLRGRSPPTGVPGWKKSVGSSRRASGSSPPRRRASSTRVTTRRRLLVEGKFNPCYYTKAFAGMDPMLGGYPTPIDTKYPYEFAAPFFKQPGDGSTHHCPMDASPDTPVQSCPKVGTGGCGEGVKDCNRITEEFGIGHVPPFVPLAAVKNAFFTGDEPVCEWFEADECTIKKAVLDRLVKKTFGTADGEFIKFTPPKILPDLPASHPKSTYYKLEYLDDPVACADDNCRGPHYCSKAAAKADIWGDFCPYIHTGENSGLYRHPHIALAAFELWIANKCKPEKCPSTWLDSPNGQGYGEGPSTSITWSEMVDNKDPMSQPAVPYKWPNSGNGIYPGHELYGDLLIKDAPGTYVTKFVAKGSSKGVGNGDKEYKQSEGACRTARPICEKKRVTEKECKAKCDADKACYAFQRQSSGKKGKCCLFRGGVVGNGRGKTDCFVATNGYTLEVAFKEAMRWPLDERLRYLSAPEDTRC